jgi:hypothetical protein
MEEMTMTQNTNQNLIKFYSISQQSFNSISTNLKPYTNSIINFLKSHKIKKFTLEDSYQITMTLLQYPTQFPLDLLKLISIFSFIQFNNLQFNQSNFINYCQQLNLQKNI